MSGPQRVTGRVLATALAAAVVIATGAWAAAAPTPPAETSSGDRGEMMLVLDASGSMAQPASGGGTRIDAAKQALQDVVDSLPDDQPVGMRVYGAEVEFASQPGGCTDSQRVVDIGTDNRDDLLSAISAYEPFGETPTGHALREAGEDLGDEGRRTIVLVSDGEPNCDPEPCEVAAELVEEGIDVRIDVVGLDVSGAARDTLKCIADAGNGSYYDADDAESLSASIVAVAQRAGLPYSTIGTPITGAIDRAQAPEIGPGDWMDTLGGKDSPRSGLFYRLEGHDPAATLHVSASILPTGEGVSSDSISVVLVRGDMDPTRVGTCGRDWQFPTQQHSLGLLSASVMWTPSEHYGRNDCAGDAPLYLWISRVMFPAGGPPSLKYAGEDSVPVEIRVIAEPPVTDEEQLRADAPADDFIFEEMPETGERAIVMPGFSFATAPLIEPGGYRGDLVSGETQLYYVDLDWGQRLQAQLRFTNADEDGDPWGRNATLRLFSPSRTIANARGLTTATGDSLPWMIWLGGVSHASTYPVQWTNRPRGGGRLDHKHSASLAGRYAIAISLEGEDEEEGARLEPYELDVVVIGEPTDPPYGEPMVAAEPTTAPNEAPDEASDDDTEEPTTIDDDAELSTEELAATQGGDSGSSSMPLLVGGLLVVVFGSAAALAVYRSRSAQAS